MSVYQFPAGLRPSRTHALRLDAVKADDRSSPGLRERHATNGASGICPDASAPVLVRPVWLLQPRRAVRHLLGRARPGWAGVLFALMASACTAEPADVAMAFVADRVAGELGLDATTIAPPAEAEAAQAELRALLSAPLTADSAAQIALLSHDGLKAEYRALAAIEAEFKRNAVPPITLEFPAGIFGIGTALDSAGNGDSLGQVSEWLERRAVGEAEYKAAAVRLVKASLATAADAKRSFYRAVGAQQTMDLLKRVGSTAEIAAELTRKQGETGAAPQLTQARAALLSAEVAAELAQAQLSVKTSREQLTRALGLAEDAFQLPAELPQIPAALKPAKLDGLDRRLDLIAAQSDQNASAWSVGLIALRSVPVGSTDAAPSSPVDHPLEAEPSPDQEHTEAADPESEEKSSAEIVERYIAAESSAAALANTARSEIREAYAKYASAHEIALLHQNSMLPLRSTIEEEMVLQYNGMLVDVLDLLAAARDSIRGHVAAVGAQRDFFIAEVDLQGAELGVTGSLETGDSPTPTATAAEDPAGH